jgi:hypothetical protein
VIVLTTFDADDNVLAALRAGAGGEAILSPDVTRRLIGRAVSTPDESDAGLP